MIQLVGKVKRTKKQLKVRIAELEAEVAFLEARNQQTRYPYPYPAVDDRAWPPAVWSVWNTPYCARTS